MTTLDWFAARYEAHGSTSGEGATKLLGRPRLNPLTVLMRETLQNAWDARTGPSLEFRVELRKFSAPQLALLRQTILAAGTEHVLCEAADETDAPQGHPGLAEALAREDLWALEIGDRGTTGLGGPLRADLDPDKGESTDFIDFIFNLGAPRDTPLGGGTYGFGKTISYVTSRAQTILVGTRTRTSNGHQHRFIASAIGRHWASQGRRYTGRHWWGRLQGGRIEPIVDEPAAALMAGVGIDEFKTDGSSILILDPDLQGRTPDEAMEFLIESFIWHLWPKMVPPPGAENPPVIATFLLEGRQLPFAHPHEIPELRAFVGSLDALRLFDAGEPHAEHVFPPPVVKTIDHGAQRLPIGTLAFTQQPAPAPDSTPDPDDDSARPFLGPSRHVALMRQAELVVDYLEGPASVVPGYEWAGVFRVCEDRDDDFAAAEPPAHDAWEWQSVADKRAKSHVRVALRKLRLEMIAFTTPELPITSTDGHMSTAGLADRLRSLMPGLAGTGNAPRTSRRDVGDPRPRRPRVSLSQPRPSYDVEYTAFVDATITAENAKAVILSVSVGVQTDTGPESAPPDGASIPRIRAVRLGDRPLEPIGPGRWHVELTQGTGTATIEVASSEPIAMRVDAVVEAAGPIGDTA